MADSDFSIRRATPSDRAAMLRVCLLTGDAGSDGSARYPRDPCAPGKRWVAPYVDLEPELAFVLVSADDTVVGYTLAALETGRFHARMQAEYLPALRQQHADPAALGLAADEWTPEQQIYHEFHDAATGAPPAGLDLEKWPSHLHIDLVEVAQGKRQGQRLMAALLDALRERGSRGVYLQMHEENARARRFYEKLGFTEIRLEGGGAAASTGGGLFLGLQL